MNPMLPMWGLGANSEPKNQNLKNSIFTSFDLSRRAHHFGVVERQNRIKMAELCPFKVATKVASWPNLGWKLAIVATFLELRTSNLFCPSFQICFSHHIETKLEVNWTQIYHFSLSKTQKWPYLKIPFCPIVNHQKAYSSYIFSFICLKFLESM